MTSVRAVVLSVTLGAGLAGTGSAQHMPVSRITPETLASVAMGRLFRFDDKSFGNRLSIGGSAGVRFGSRLGAEGEFNQMLGLSLEPAQCGVVVPPCSGTARHGMRSAKVLSANLLYYFGGLGAQFYITGGAGALFSKEVTTIVQVGPTEATFGEVENADTGFAWNLGAGVRIPVGARFLVRPEFRFYEASALSRANLSLTRFSIGSDTSGSPRIDALPRAPRKMYS